jgi:hypothetical protein
LMQQHMSLSAATAAMAAAQQAEKALARVQRLPRCLLLQRPATCIRQRQPPPPPPLLPALLAALGAQH